MNEWPAPHASLHAVVFDCDGVLVDSERITNGVLAGMLAEQGLAIDTDAVVSRFMGRIIKDALPEIAGMVGHELPSGWYDQFTARRDAALASRVEPIEGVADVVQHVRRHHLRYAVASGADCPKMRITLGRSGMLGWFEPVMFGRDMVARGKPFPDVYELALRELGVEAGNTVVIEDTPTGTRAGVAARCRVLGYAAALGADPLLEAGAVDTFMHMHELPAMLAREITARSPN